MAKSAIFTDEESVILDKLQTVRLDIVNNMTMDGVPDKVGEIRVLNEVISAADKKITDTATLRLKETENANNEAAVSMVVELLHQSRARKQKCTNNGDAPAIPSDLAKVETVPGEIEINPEPLDPSEFIAPKFDTSKA